MTSVGFCGGVAGTAGAAVTIGKAPGMSLAEPLGPALLGAVALAQVAAPMPMPVTPSGLHGTPSARQSDAGGRTAGADARVGDEVHSVLQGSLRAVQLKYLEHTDIH